MPDPSAPPVATPPAMDYGLAGTAVHMALALLLVLAVIFAAYWLLKRYGGKWGIGPAGRGGMLRLLAQLNLGPRKNIVVVRFMHKNLVLGVTEHNITLLTEETADDDDTTARNSFAATLAARTRTPGGDDTPPSP